MENDVFIGLGSNVGNRVAYLRRAVRALKEFPQTRWVAVSAVYETSPVGPRQRNFFNAVARLRSTLPPEEWLRRLKALEKHLGRRRRGHWGPREIDLDLLFVGDERRRGDLRLPHPRWKERKFVLAPLLDVAPRFRDPVSGCSALAILRQLRDPSQKIARTAFRIP